MLYVMGLMPLLEQIRTTARCTLYHLAASWRITSNVQQLGAHLLPGNCPNQQFATAANTQQGLPLKAALRQLYKRVHPDLFTGYPVEQAENERSFKLLQDYLHQARTTRPSLGPTSRTAYHFKFYLTPEDTETSESLAAPSNSASASLHLVQQTLAPPEPSRPTPGHLSPAVVKALGKLLTACGLTPVQVDQQEEEDALASMNKLTHFLPAAAEMIRQHESGTPQYEVQMANLRAALRMAYALKAGFLPNAFTGQQKVELLQRLTAALDLTEVDSGEPLDLAGMHLLICHKTALDNQGTLCLDAAGSAEDWADFLGGVDLEYAAGKQHTAASMRELEAGTAQAVGVRMIFTAGPNLMTHEYRSFLEQLAAYAARHGPVQAASSSSVNSNIREQPYNSSRSTSSKTSNANPSTKQQSYQQVPLYVAPVNQQGQQQDRSRQEQQSQVVHEATGYIMVHMDASAYQVYKTIKAHGGKAVDIITRRQQQQQELSQLTNEARNRLRLRRLTKDELITHEDYVSACKQLLSNRDLLLRCNIEGLSVRISDKNRVVLDAATVDIACNFHL